LKLSDRTNFLGGGFFFVSVFVLFPRSFALAFASPPPPFPPFPARRFIPRSIATAASGENANRVLALTAPVLVLLGFPFRDRFAGDGDRVRPSPRSRASAAIRACVGDARTASLVPRALVGARVNRIVAALPNARSSRASRVARATSRATSRASIATLATRATPSRARSSARARAARSRAVARGVIATTTIAPIPILGRTTAASPALGGARASESDADERDERGETDA
jgi:hypothetical protein